MPHKHPESDNRHSRESWLFSRTGIVTAGAVAILGFLVYTGHSAHLLGFVPYLFILACPLMHIFMHGGHHGQHAAKDGEQSRSHEHGSGCCGDSDHDKKPGDKPSLGSRQEK